MNSVKGGNLVSTVGGAGGSLLHRKPQILDAKWDFPKIRGTILGVSIIRTRVFWGLYWGPLIMGNYQILNLEPQEWVLETHSPTLPSAVPKGARS